jgi:DNA recombination protein RmuC
MDTVVLTIGQRAFTLGEVTLAGGALGLLLLLLLLIGQRRANRERLLEAVGAAERAREADDKLAEVNRLQAELSGRLQTVAEVFGGRQADLTRQMSERMDGLRAALGQGLQQTGEKTAEHLSKLSERLAVIDQAQNQLGALASEMVALKDVLSNKQARGAYGQGRMEAIIRDALPSNAFTFQATLSNRTRPDCLIHLPGDERPLAVDAKFPLEAFSALRESHSDEARAVAERRVRQDVSLHIRDIAEKYVGSGETQDMALLFVPSEALYADLMEHFEDVIQKAHRARVIIVSPSLLMLAIQVVQALVRDARMREQARTIQVEVSKLIDDVRRLQERAGKLETHFRQAQEDIAGVMTSADKIGRRGEKIEQLEFEESQGNLALQPQRQAAE